MRSANAEFQVLESLRNNRQKRNRENAFLVEGVRNIDAAFAHGWVVRSVLAGTVKSEWAQSVCARADDVVEMSAPLFASLTDRDEPPELLLVVEKRRVTLEQVGVDDQFVATVLDRPAYPGNIGTILRTCDALGGSAVFLTGHGADPYDPQSIRASTGSFFAVPIVEIDNTEQLVTWARDHGVTLVATDEAGDTRLEDAPPRKVALLMGNEASGLSRGLREAAEVTVSIPMQGTASSLNVAAAHAIALYAVVSAR